MLHCYELVHLLKQRLFEDLGNHVFTLDVNWPRIVQLVSYPTLVEPVGVFVGASDEEVVLAASLLLEYHDLVLDVVGVVAAHHPVELLLSVESLFLEFERRSAVGHLLPQLETAETQTEGLEFSV